MLYWIFIGLTCLNWWSLVYAVDWEKVSGKDLFGYSEYCWSNECSLDWSFALRSYLGEVCPLNLGDREKALYKAVRPVELIHKDAGGQPSFDFRHALIVLMEGILSELRGHVRSYPEDLVARLEDSDQRVFEGLDRLQMGVKIKARGIEVLVGHLQVQIASIGDGLREFEEASESLVRADRLRLETLRGNLEDLRAEVATKSLALGQLRSSISNEIQGRASRVDGILRLARRELDEKLDERLVVCRKHEDLRNDFWRSIPDRLGDTHDNTLTRLRDLYSSSFVVVDRDKSKRDRMSVLFEECRSICERVRDNLNGAARAMNNAQ